MGSPPVNRVQRMKTWGRWGVTLVRLFRGGATPSSRFARMSAAGGPRLHRGVSARALRNRGLSALAALAVLVPVLLAGCVAPVSPAPRVNPAGLPPEQAAREERNLRLFDTVWVTVDRRYYDAGFHGVDWRAAALAHGPEAAAAGDETALYGVVNGMLGLLGDGHTGALTPAEARDWHAQERAMTGFRILRIDRRWVVSEVLPGSPAEAAGVKPGWIVLSRDGQPLGDRFSLPSLRGGERVRWEFLDGRDQPVALALTARRVSVAREVARVLPGGLVFLRFDEFDWSSMRWLCGELKRRRDAPGVVVDLRQNPGGVLLALDFMVGEFFDRSFAYAVSVDRSGRRRNLHAMTLGSARYHGRLVVLVDHPSASAAEIFAATMQEQHRGTIVGRKTAGDVLGARMRSLPGGGMLEYSDCDLRTAKGSRLNGNGVIPDVQPAAITLADLRSGRDPDIEEALRILQRP